MEVSIEMLEKYLYANYGERGNEQGLFMKLVEEMGEVAEILNMRTGRKRADDVDLTHELGVELADMIHYTVAIAAINNIDLASIILEKDKKAAIKYNHEINLEDFIAKQENI